MSKIPFAEAKSWMFEAALPFWAAHGVDHVDGGFYEELSLGDGAPTDIGFKRVRAMCRQVYVFSHAALLGWAEGAAHSEAGFAYVQRHAWQGPGQGWAKLLSRSGAVLDATPDLYDQAFGLFACAWRHRLAGDAESLALAHATLDFIEARLADSEHGGFWNAWPPGASRGQNPHMHVAEATLAMFEACGEARFLDIASSVFTLFQKHFFDGRTLGEHFTHDWRRSEGEPGRVIEPGHHFEWAWILGQLQRHMGSDTREAVRALIAFAEAHGVDAESGAALNRVRDDGALLDGGSRTWPNTERIKGWLAHFELNGADPRAAVAQSTQLLLRRYLDVRPRGAWMDRFDSSGAPVPGPAPASTFYHLFVAFAELLRLEPVLAAKA